MRLLILLLVTCLLLGPTSGATAEPPSPGGPATAPLVVMGWGGNAFGTLGDPTASETRDVAGFVVGPGGSGRLDTITTIAVGQYHVLALDRNGTVWAWGYNQHGTLGDNDMPNDSDIPVQVLDAEGDDPLRDVVAIAAGTNHSLALKADGSVWSWGWAGDGALGDGTFEETGRDLPVQVKDESNVGTLADVVQIAAGFDQSLAMTADGAVYAWGSDEYGQLGNGLPLADSAVPTRVKDTAGTGFLAGIKSLAASSWSSFALTTAGQLVGWGYNNEGQLADGTVEDRALPVAAKGVNGSGTLANVKSFDAGSYHSLATLSDGTALSWGYNYFGQLGTGSKTDRHLPGSILDGGEPIKDVVSVRGGSYHSLAMRRDGTVWAWGRDLSGQLGNGPVNLDQVEPVQVVTAAGPLTSVVGIDSGVDSDSSFALARTATASLKAPATTRSRTIGVTFGGASVFGIDGYYIGESPVPPSATSDGWLATPPVAYTIQSPGDGTKTLYAFTRDGQDYVSPAAMASVRVDTTAPTISFRVPRFSGSKLAKVTLRGADAGGVAGYMVKSNAGRPTASSRGWKSTPPATVPLTGRDGTKKLYAWVKDAAGNVSATGTATTMLDTKKPGVAITAPARNAKIERLGAIAGRATDAKPGSGLKTLRAAIQRKVGSACSWWVPRTGRLVAGPCGAPRWFSIPLKERWTRNIGLDTAGSYTLYAEATDRAAHRTRTTRAFAIRGDGSPPASR